MARLVLECPTLALQVQPVGGVDEKGKVPICRGQFSMAVTQVVRNIKPLQVCVAISTTPRQVLQRKV